MEGKIQKVYHVFLVDIIFKILKVFVWYNVIYCNYIEKYFALIYKT
jgi:hypothetical protein